MENSMGVQLPYEPAFPLLGIKEKTKILIWKYTFTPVLTAALFTIDKMWKQPKCSSTDEWIKKVWFVYTHTHTHSLTTHTHNGILLNCKKEWNNAIWSNMDGPRDHHTKGSKSDREKDKYKITYLWNLKKMIQMNLFTKQK